jgi:hypothetical protein
MAGHLLRLPVNQRCTSTDLPLERTLGEAKVFEKALTIWQMHRLTGGDWRDTVQIAGIDHVTHLYDVTADDPGNYFLARQRDVSPLSTDIPLRHLPLREFTQAGTGQCHIAGLVATKSKARPVFQEVAFIINHVYCRYKRLLCPVSDETGQISEIFSTVNLENSRVVPRLVGDAGACDGDQVRAGSSISSSRIAANKRDFHLVSVLDR